MRKFTLILGLAVLLVCRFAAADCVSDSIELTVEPGSVAGELALSWSGFNPLTQVYRSTDPSTMTAPENFLGETEESIWTDLPPAGQDVYYRVYRDYDQDGVIDCLDGCAFDPLKLDPGLCGCGTPDTDTDTDGTPDCLDFCDNDPNKVERGLCGCGQVDSEEDGDGDGVIDCWDQCPGFDDLVDSDDGGLADLCDPCPSGLCELTLPDQFYVELPEITVSRISRDGRWIAGIERDTFRGVLIPTEQLLANPGDTSYYEYLPDEQVNEFYGFSDDNNIVLAGIDTAVPESSSKLVASALYDRTNQTWRVLGLYDSSINVDSCHFYSNGGDITSNGRVIYGRTPTLENACDYSAFRYGLMSDEWQIFGGPEGNVRLLEGVSGDGGAIVGSENSTTNGVETAVVWSFTPPDLFTPSWLGEGGVAYDVTFDGSAVALSARGGSPLSLRAHRWTAAGGLQQLGAGTLDSGWGAHAVAISDDGTVVVGYHSVLLSSGLPFIWLEGLGFGNLRDYLIFQGHTNLGNFGNTYVALDVSGNGRIIIGNNGGTLSRLPGWVVVTRHD
jgi:hypothetical protein